MLLVVLAAAACERRSPPSRDTPFQIERVEEWPDGPGAPAWRIRGAAFAEPIVVPVWREVYRGANLGDEDLIDCHTKFFAWSATELEGGTWLLYQDNSRCGTERCAWLEPCAGTISRPGACPPIISFTTSPRHLAGDLYELFRETEGVASVSVVRWRRGAEPTQLFSIELGSSGASSIEARPDGIHAWLPCDPRQGCVFGTDYNDVPARHWRWQAQGGWKACTLALGEPLGATAYRAGAWSGTQLYLARDHTAYRVTGEWQAFRVESVYRAPRRRGGPMSGAIADLWANGDNLVVGTDSTVHILSGARAGPLHELSEENYFDVAFLPHAMVAVGGQGVAVYPRCQEGAPCRPLGLLDEANNAYDIALRGDTAYVIDGGTHVVAVALDGTPRRVGELSLPGARALVAMGERLVAATADGRLQVVAVSDPARMQVTASVLARIGVTTRLRAQDGRLWVVGGGHVALFALGADGPPVLVADQSTKAELYDLVLAGERRLLLSSAGLYSLVAGVAACGD